MKFEIVEMNHVQIIGIAKEIAFCTGGEECPKFWGEYVENYIKPVVMEGKTPNAQQKAVFDNNIGEFGLCTCTLRNHNCGTCAVENFTACNKKTFTYVIGGTYKGGEVPEGMKLYPLQDGQWLKVHFEGGMKAFQQQFKCFHDEWLPAHPEYKWASNSCCMEWYCGEDISSPDYQCGIIMPLA